MTEGLVDLACIIVFYVLLKGMLPGEHITLFPARSQGPISIHRLLFGVADSNADTGFIESI
jgi:hypothetical protein